MNQPATAIYLRSSKDRSDVSIDAQRRALTQLAGERGLKIVREYSDIVSSGKDEDRPGFQSLVADLRNRTRGWSTLLLLDTSRLARRQHIAVVFEHEADKHGVRILYKSVPDAGDIITNMFTKSILQAVDELHSLTSRQKGLAGMAENVRQGFRAGGRAPLGYRLVKVPTGTIREGEEVHKSRLEPDDKAVAVAAYLGARARGIPRARAAHAAGLDAPATSLLGMEANALTYAGHTVWNSHNEYSRGGYKGGIKRRPRSEWVIKRDTHKALISDAVAETILSQLETGKRRYGYVKTEFLLAGLLTAPDGENWRGEGKRYRYRAKKGSGKYVNADEIEAAVWSQVVADTGSDDFILRLVKQTRQRLKKPIDNTKKLHKEVVALNVQISRMMDLAGQMSIAAPALRKVEELDRQRGAIVAEIARLDRERAAEEAMAGITEDQVRAILADVLDGAPKRQVLDNLVERIQLDPATLEARIEYRIEYRRNLASPRQCENAPILRFSSILGIRG